MKKINDKGVTLIELIVSFAIVGVAIIYFFQTLYTVKKVYATARNETNEFIDKDYTYRILDKYFDNNSLFNTNNICNDLNLPCKSVTYIEYNNRMSKYKIQWTDNDFSYYYKYKGILDSFSSSTSPASFTETISNGTIEFENCGYACATNVSYADFLVSNERSSDVNEIKFTFPEGITVNDVKIEYNQNYSENYCSLCINDNCNINDFSTEHTTTEKYGSLDNVESIALVHGKPRQVNFFTCYANITHFDVKTEQ